MRSFLNLVSSTLLLLFCSEAFACDSAPRPRPQSIVRFYDSQAFGRLGVKALGDNVYILDHYQCYDLSFIRNKSLSLFFNNASKSDDADATYVGAIVVRTFSRRDYSEGPYAAYLYRNSSANDGGTSKWAHLKQQAQTPAWGPSSAFEILNGKYDPDDPLRSTSFSDLLKRLQRADADNAAQLKQWHALVVAPDADGYRVLHDTARSDRNWSLMVATPGADNGYTLVRAYLVKYQASESPTARVFFEIGATAADCVYLKLVGPGDAVSELAIQPTNESRDVITLKMRATAVCKVLN
jgi:hypothetical protein